MDSVFTDRWGREVCLTAERWSHITKHPEMQNKYHEVELTINFPDFIEEDLYRNNVVYYYRYVKQDHMHLMVVVVFIEQHKGNILTAYMVKK